MAREQEMKGTRKKRNPGFKAKVVLAAIKGERTDLFEALEPFAAGLLNPVPGDAALPRHNARCSTASAPPSTSSSLPSALHPRRSTTTKFPLVPL
jgi:hypothetical protein